MSAATTRIVIFAKAPVPGSVKTRLIPALGKAGAALLAQRLLAKTVDSALVAGLANTELCAAPHPADPQWAGHLPAGVRLADQGEGNLGQRLSAAATRVIDGGERVLLIGTDCPDLDSARLCEAAAQLDRHDAVIFPARDGGYVLLGLARTDPSLFADIAWSTSTVAATTIARIRTLGWSLYIGDTLSDIDEPADLDRAQALP
ncbi:MAG: TIGR04282 family arsenosugar biosynthesis glycosyltransferase [Novosphingobium sp.]|nr:TIGR04282 family arsenosugar biosynthesis glycosyltransferase [Novosphingobium sp.]